MDLFEEASKRALRFNTIKGNITTEDLWNMPLLSKSNFDLDTVARSVNNELKMTAEEESFVQPRQSATRIALELKLAIVKHVIAARQQQAAQAAQRSLKEAERARLLRALDAKDAQALDALSADDVRARIAALDSALFVEQ